MLIRIFEGEYLSWAEVPNDAKKLDIYVYSISPKFSFNGDTKVDVRYLKDGKYELIALQDYSKEERTALTVTDHK